MLCPICGVEVGESARLCDACQKRADEEQARQPIASEDEASAVELPPETSRTSPTPSVEEESPPPIRLIEEQRPGGDALLLIFSHPLMLISGAAFLLVISYFVFVNLDPMQKQNESMMLAGVFTLFILSFVSWAWMWIQLITNEIALGVIALFLPFMVYLLLLSHPDRAVKPFFVHCVATIMLIPLMVYFKDQTGTEAYNALEKLLGGTGF